MDWLHFPKSAHVVLKILVLSGLAVPMIHAATPQVTPAKVLPAPAPTRCSIPPAIAPTYYPIGGGPHSLALGDLNSDGNVDVAVSDQSRFNVRVFLGSGAGGIAYDGEYSTNSNPRSVATADVDNDGDLDLAVGSEWTSHVSVLLNFGDGRFGPPHYFEAVPGLGVKAYCVLLEDIEADGDVDLVVGTQVNQPTVSVRLNTGGTFDTPTLYQPISSTWQGSIVSAIEAGDMNLDGQVDIVAAISGSGRPSGPWVLQSAGNGTLFSAFETQHGIGPITDMDLGDFDMDGHLDVALGLWSNLFLSMYRNLGDGTLTAGASYSMPTGRPCLQLEAADIDHDGMLDIVGTVGLPWCCDTSIVALMNTGSGRFASMTTIDLFGQAAYGLTTNDLNKNRIPDVIIADGVGCGILLDLCR